MLVAGEAGIGKTALVESVVGKSSGIVLRGAARAASTPPLWPLVAALRSHADLPAGTTEEVEAVCRTIVALAKVEPLILILDDLQWVDHATGDAFPVLASAIQHVPVLIVGIYRTDELARTSPVRRVRTELRRAGRLSEITLDALEPAAVLDLSTRLLGATPDQILAQRIIDQSQGVPLFVEELVAALVSAAALTVEDGLAKLKRDDLPVPESIRDSVLGRIEGLGPRTREALGVAALIGDRADISVVDALVAGAGDWPRAGADAGILADESAGQVVFRHALVREVVGEDLPSPDRRAYHARIATILADRGGDPLDIANHWLASDDAGLGVDWLIRAGDASCRVHAFRDAATAFRRALDEDRGRLTDRVAIVERLAECAELSGVPGEAARTWQVAASIRLAAGDEIASAQDQRRRARALEVQGRWKRAIEARLVASDLFARSGDPADAAIERLAVGTHLRSSASFTAALEVLVVARSDAQAADRVDLVARVMGQEGNVLARMGQTDIGIALVREGLTMALDHGATEAAAELYQRLADALEHGGQRGSARNAYTEGAAYCRAQAIEGTALLCMACMSVVLWQTGEWGTARLICREVVVSSESSLHARAVAEGILGLVSAARGQPGRARPHLETCLAIGRRIELVAMELLSIWGLAMVDRLEGDDEAAVERCRDVLARWDRTEERHFVVPALRWAATLHGERADAAGVRACAEALARIAAQTGQREAVASLGLALGEAARLEGDPASAANHLERAFQAVSDEDLPLDRAEIGRRFGLALIAVERREEGLRTLVAAARTARRLGAYPLADGVGRDLRALGESVERRLGRREAQRLADGGLTKRELEILRLVAKGMTSRAIGEDLFISTRTVEMHVGSAMMKLDCRTRAEAVQRIGALGLLI